MEKALKRLLGVVISIAIAASCSVTAFAAEPPRYPDDLAAIEVDYEMIGSGGSTENTTLEVQGYIILDGTKDPGDSGLIKPDTKEPVNPGKPGAAPKTGDTNQVEWYLILGLSLLFFLFLAFFQRRKEEEKQEEPKKKVLHSRRP